jgi:uncharacterized protein YukE
MDSPLLKLKNSQNEFKLLIEKIVNMSDVHGNPDEMRQFAYHLNKLAMDFRGLRDSTRAKMNQLSQSWRDNENAQSVQQFEQDLKPMEKLVQTAEEYSTFLKKKAATLDVYLNTKK